MSVIEYIQKLEDLLNRYRKDCGCWGDQYGGWGPCKLCDEKFKLKRPEKLRDAGI